MYILMTSLHWDFAEKVVFTLHICVFKIAEDQFLFIEELYIYILKYIYTLQLCVLYIKYFCFILY